MCAQQIESHALRTRCGKDRLPATVGTLVRDFQERGGHPECITISCPDDFEVKAEYEVIAWGNWDSTRRLDPGMETEEPTKQVMAHPLA